ncbi:hypothetical protein JW930_02365 [Candidatus Woesearchaeota archaeon]|nr:hypothetical protein [Candidatus Woesearchaeota archaeon]
MIKKKARPKPFFKKKIRPSTFILFSLALIAALLLFRKIAIYLLLTLFTSTFVYANYYIKLPFDISPVLFLSLIISSEYGFVFAVFFIIASGIIPMVMAGGSFDHTTLFYLSLIIGINLLNSHLVQYPFMIVAIPLVILHHILGAVGSISFGTLLQKEILNLITQIIKDLFYILSFSKIVLGFF